jgi:tRNA pseudouridine13 synthase
MSSNELPYAHGLPPLRARLRAEPEDFFVEEILGYEADGQGEHALLLVEKRGQNTEWVARELARFAGVSPNCVSFAGMKDRHAVTRQTFSVQLPGKADPDWTTFPHADAKVIQSSRHKRKIKRGGLRGNRFVLVLREIEGDRAAAEERLAAIAARGVPNYFGEQRFGHGGANVDQALAMFAGRRMDRAKRSILLSAARSHLFNSVLAERAQNGQWDTPMDGEIWSLEGSRSWFGPEEFSDVLAGRLAEGDIHPSGPLWGRGDLPSTGAVAALETAVAAANPEIAAGLVEAGMDQERRSLRLVPRQFAWRWLETGDLEVSFELQAGAYATTVIREVAVTV